MPTPYPRRPNTDSRRSVRWWEREVRKNEGQGDIRRVLGAGLGSGVLSLVIAGIYEYFSLRGVISVALAWVILVGVWIIAVTGVVISEIVWGQRLRYRAVIGVGFAVALGLGLFGLDKVTSLIVGASALQPPEPWPIVLEQDIELAKLRDFITSNHAGGIRFLFDIDGCLNKNIQIQRDRIILTAHHKWKSPNSYYAYIEDGRSIVALEVSNKYRHYEGATIHITEGPHNVFFAVPTRQYVEANQQLDEFLNSALLPSDVKNKLMALRKLLGINFELLMRTLNDEKGKSDLYFSRYGQAPYYFAIQDDYAKAYKSMEPAGGQVLDAISRHWHAD